MPLYPSGSVCFILHPNIMDIVYKTLEIIHHCRTTSTLSSMVLSLDIEKVFDQVETNYLLAVLVHMVFDLNFITTLQTIYLSPTARIKLNGAMSSPFYISRGTREGCPLSPLLFMLAIESLVEALRLSTRYSGI